MMDNPYFDRLLDRMVSREAHCTPAQETILENEFSVPQSDEEARRLFDHINMVGQYTGKKVATYSVHALAYFCDMRGRLLDKNADFDLEIVSSQFWHAHAGLCRPPENKAEELSFSTVKSGLLTLYFSHLAAPEDYGVQTKLVSLRELVWTAIKDKNIAEKINLPAAIRHLEELPSPEF